MLKNRKLEPSLNRLKHTSNKMLSLKSQVFLPCMVVDREGPGRLKLPVAAMLGTNYAQDWHTVRTFDGGIAILMGNSILAHCQKYWHIDGGFCNSNGGSPIKRMLDEHCIV